MPASAWGQESLGRGVHTDTHTDQKSVCQEFGGRGSFLWRKSQGRKRGHPPKTLDRKEVPGFGSGMRGGKRRQPLDEGAEPAGLPAWGWAMPGRGESPFVPPRAPCKPPAHRPSPLPSSPWAGCPLRPRAPSRAEPRAEAKWRVRVVVSLKPCSYGAAPHRDQRALGSATPPSFPTRRSQGTSEGKIQTQKQQAGEGSPPDSRPPPAPIPGVFTLGSLPLCLERDGCWVRLPSCKQAGSFLVRSSQALALSSLCSCLYTSLQHSRSSF